MKKFAVLLLAVIVGVVSLWMLLRSPPSSSPIQLPTKNPNDSSDSNSAAPLGRTPVAVSPPTTEGAASATSDLVGLAYLATVKRLMLKDNQPVEFYARAIDQHGMPVRGALLKMNLSRVNEELVKAKFPHMNMGDELTNEVIELTSDTQGWFEITGKTGKSLYVLSLSKDGYLWVSPPLSSWLYERGGKHNYGYKGMETAFDRKTGYTFQMWRKGPTEPLLWFDHSVAIAPYGTNWYGVDLFRGSVPDQVRADFRFWFCLATNAVGQPYRQFRFETPSGGLLTNQNLYPYQAPSEGYSTGWDCLFEPFGKDANRNADDALKHQFYLHSRNRKIYASLTWHWSTAYSVRISGYLNPNGSTNLEPDPEKLITDPQEIRRLDETTRVP